MKVTFPLIQLFSSVIIPLICGILRNLFFSSLRVSKDKERGKTVTRYVSSSNIPHDVFNEASDVIQMNCCSFFPRPRYYTDQTTVHSLDLSTRNWLTDMYVHVCVHMLYVAFLLGTVDTVVQ